MPGQGLMDNAAKLYLAVVATVAARSSKLDPACQTTVLQLEVELLDLGRRPHRRLTARAIDQVESNQAFR